MKKILYFKIFIALAILTLSAGANAQTPVTRVPYFCGFEDATENAKWILNPAPPTNPTLSLINKWTIGGATVKSGDSALYINGFLPRDVAQYDGSQNSVMVAYREFQLPAGSYDLSFDWRCLGDSLKFEAMYVYFMPSTGSVASSIYTGTVNTPPSPNSALKFTNRQNTSPLCNSTGWQQAIAQLPIVDGVNTYRLTFVFVINADGKDFSPGGCVDNINIAKRGTGCFAAPTNLNVNVVGTATRVSWNGPTGSNTKYEVRYYGDNSPTVYNTIIQGRTYYDLPTSTLPEGIYSVMVRSICGSDTSIFVSKGNILVYDVAKHCLDIFNLTDANCWIGNVVNPYQTHKVVDFGPASYTENNMPAPASPSTGDLKTSRQTVHYIPGETDPNAPLLKTKPDGAIASVRVGNANVGSYAEAVEYKYTVPAQNPGVLTLKYAVVIQDPSHPAGNGSRVTFEFLDVNGNGISPCTTGDFSYSVNTSSWNTYETSSSNYGIWKDWSAIGVNLAPYAGQTITIRVTNRDCELGSHYAYCYFTLDCGSGIIESNVSCADKPQQFVVAEGFNYRWYPKYYPSATLGTSNVFNVTPTDTTTYCVDMISLLNPACKYTLEASAMRKMPRALAEFEWKPENCVNKVIIKNKSDLFGYYYPSGSFLEDSIPLHKPLDKYEWDFGIYGKRYGSNPGTITFPKTGDTITVKLKVSLNDCVDSASFTLRVPAITTTYNTTNYYICETDLPFTSPDGHVFNRPTPANPTETYQFITTNFAGCDSIVSIIVRALSPKTIDEGDITIGQGFFLVFHGDTIRTTGQHEYHKKSAVLNCDSIIYIINVKVTAATDDLKFDNIKISPNPVKDELRIKNDELRIKNVEIVDLSGKTAPFNSPAGGNSFPFGEGQVGASINVANLASGIYFVKIKTDKGIITRKFVKQ